jgi:hypothetical protein
MRAVLLLIAAMLAACASEELALAPPAGVDLSGRWKLNPADSDDPQRLSQALSSGAGSPAGGGRSGGQRGGGQSGGRQSGAQPAPLPAGVPVPVAAVAEVLHWPGKDLEVRQSGGVVTFISDGESRVYRPLPPSKKTAAKAHEGGDQICGWDGHTLIIDVEPDDDRPKFEERYRVSEDGGRFVQVIVITEGRDAGFSMSRVWDRVP